MADKQISLQLAIDKFKSKLSEAQSGLDGLKDRFEAIQNVGQNMTMYVTAPLIGAGGLALKTAADFEQLEVSFSTMLGSGERGIAMMESLKEFSAGTPFQMQGIAQSTKMLLGFGTSAEEMLPTLQRLGDLSAGSGKHLEDIARIFGKVQAKGRLTNEELNQFNEGGIPVMAELARQLNVTKDEVIEMASQGSISFKMMDDAIKGLTSNGGMFTDMMQKQSQTLSGVFSTLKDNVTNALATIGADLAETFDINQIVKDVTTAIQGMTEAWNSLSDGAKKAIFTFGAIATAIGPVLMGVGAIGKTIPLLVSGFSSLVGAGTKIIGILKTVGIAMAGVSAPVWATIGAVTALSSIGIYLAYNWETVKNRFSRLTAQIQNFFADMVQGAINRISALLSYLNMDLPDSIKNMAESLRAEVPKIDSEWKSVGQVFDEVKSDVGDAVGNIVDSLGIFADDTAQTAEDVKASTDTIREAVSKPISMGPIVPPEAPETELMESGSIDLSVDDTGLERIKGDQQTVQAMLERGMIESLANVRQYRSDLNAEMLQATTDAERTAIQGTLNGLARLEQGMAERANATGSAYQAFGETMQATNARLTDSVMNTAMAMEGSFSEMGSSMLSNAANIVKAEMMSAVATQIRKAITTIPFPFNIGVAGGAMLAVKGLFSKIPKLASGGVVSGRSVVEVGEYAGAYSNPEVIAPLDKLKNIISPITQQGNAERQEHHFNLFMNGRKVDTELRITKNRNALLGF